jgi:hypothetical protein
LACKAGPFLSKGWALAFHAPLALVEPVASVLLLWLLATFYRGALFLFSGPKRDLKPYQRF